MQSVKIKAYAKLNLSLDVTGRNGKFHDLDSFVCSIDVCDTLVLKKRKDTLVNVYFTGKDADKIPFDNNAVKAGEKFVEVFGTTGADVTVMRDIPSGGGLGGSSADAAGVLKGMAKLYQKEREGEKLKEIADSLGSDTGYLLTGGFARLSGRGERVRYYDEAPQLYFLLLQPQSSVSTPLCFAEYDREPSPYLARTQALEDAFLRGDLTDMAKYMGNDLQNAATRLSPDVKKAIEEGESFSPLACAMTGSGSCVFVFFENEAFCAWAKSRYRGKCRARIVRSITPNRPKKITSPYALTDEEKNLLKNEE